MIRTKGFLLCVAVATVFFTLVGAGFGAQRPSGDLVRHFQSGNPVRHLDEDFTQLFYVKTTDFGATWSGITQAGNLATTYETSGSLPDLSACITNGNELCYAVYLQGAPTPGVYSFTGPNFAPVLAMAEGTNDLHSVGGSSASGWTDIGRTPNGDLFIIVWGLNSIGETSFWGIKSTTNGASWGAPFVIAAQPQIDATAEYPHIADVNDDDWCFMIFQDVGETGYDQWMAHFPSATGQATIAFISTSAEESRNYYIGACKPIAYDPAANALYAVYWNEDASGAHVVYSNDNGQTFSSGDIAFSVRYPSVALRTTGQTPFVISNRGLPAVDARHMSWYSYDEFGYNGGSWTTPDTLMPGPLPFDGTYPIVYVNQAYFWDANQGIASHNIWGSFTPEELWTSRTANGGVTWGTHERRWAYVADSLDAASLTMNEIVGGTNGVAYVVSSGRHGTTDLSGPGFSAINLLTSPATLGPYVFSAAVNDNNVDPADNHITFWINQFCADDSDTLDSDSSQISDPNTNSGTYFFHIPTSVCGHTIAQGDTVWYYLWGRDLVANSGESVTQAIVAGVTWLAADDPTSTTPTAFALHTNYPNPFNPETKIAFDLAAPSHVTLSVYNTLGQVVRTLADNVPMGAGQYSITFNGSDLPSGLYLYRLTAGNFSETRKMMLVK